MADKMRSGADRPNADGATGHGGGKGARGVIEVDAVGNARLRGEDPSPDDRPRGDRSTADRTGAGRPR